MRTYIKGRPTYGWSKGKELTRLDQILVGMVMIEVNHQFEAENLVQRIVPPMGFMNLPGTEVMYIHFVSPDLERHETPMAVYEWELSPPHNAKRLFEAVPDPVS